MADVVQWIAWVGFGLGVLGVIGTGAAIALAPICDSRRLTLSWLLAGSMLLGSMCGLAGAVAA